MKITISGSGYVGLVTGACLAEMGNHVMSLDVDPRKIAVLQSGGVPIHEPGLDVLIQRNAKAGRLQFTTDIERAVQHGTVQFVAVGTPPGEDGSADLSYVVQAARAIGERMTDYKLIVDKSTVPVGTGDVVEATVREALAARGVELQFSVVSNPEFLKEGAAIADFMKPDRVIVGSEDDDERAIHLMRALYAPFIRNRDRLLVMDVRSAELTKYAANAMLATRISFMNDLANLAERLGADIELVRQGIGSDPRIGTQFLYPGCGYGGSCFPKDVRALLHTGEQAGLGLPVLRAVEAVNHGQKRLLVDKIVARFGEDLTGCRFALWGLAFKPGTDDMREAPSLVVMRELIDRGALVVAYDPVALDEARARTAQWHGVEFATSAAEAVKGADALVIVTEWKEFRSPDFDALRAGLKQPLIFDGRNLFDPLYLTGLGFDYRCVGRAAVQAAGDPR
ncbi:MAG: UDP-glucose/GDP-mannose dehydrogenase family protein [Burkholderiaceae bacterium]|nr:UDP-glucose/GDP-mannose dehydrogenase family protein [Burkholderiaceae bacterium]